MPPYTRIVSLLPSATEIICELGAAAALRGVTHACPQPAGLPPVPCVVAPAFDASLLDGAGIDARVRAIRREGGDVLALDGDALRDARPDLVICQDTCRACAPYAEQVGGAIEALCGSPEVHSMDPRDMAGIMECISELAALLGREDGGRRLRESLESRVGAVRSAAAGALGDNDGRRPRVLALEWLDPLYTAGHWVPEMVEAAGGENLLSSAGEHSRRMEIGEAAASGPDLAVIMPCGFDAARAAAEYSAPGAPLASDARWRATRAARAGRVYAVDADGYFSKPSIRMVDGIAILAGLLWPDARGIPPAPPRSHVRLGA